ncbi:hypothetical protein IC582_011595 [Cucumis melo]
MCLNIANERQGKVGRRAYLEKWLTSFPPIFAEESVFEINFEWEDDFGYPGAFYIRNGHTSEFFLKSLTLEDVPNYGKVHFDCNSWVYPQRRYNKDRIFFANKVYYVGIVFIIILFFGCMMMLKLCQPN